MLKILFTNTSKTSFKRSAYHYDQPKLMTTAPPPVQLPADVLQTYGSEAMTIQNEFDGILGFIGNVMTSFWCCWTTEDEALRFGVRVNAYGQPLGIGKQPDYSYMYDNAPTNAGVKWLTPGNPAEQTTFIVKGKEQAFRVKIDSISKHTEITVKVSINQSKGE